MRLATIARVKFLGVEEIIFVWLMCAVCFLLDVLDRLFDILVVLAEVLALLALALALALAAIVEAGAVHLQAMRLGARARNVWCLVLRS
jgi:hypothetical protein